MHVDPKTDFLGTVIIDDFRGEYFFLSNFYVRPIVLENITFHSSEQAYMWYKTLDPKEQASILEQNTPRKVKQYCGQEAGKITLRSDWDEIRAQVMYRVLWEKFTQHADLGERLLATGDAILSEGNLWHDNYWGECSCDGCRSKIKENMLGKLLMAVREKLSGVPLN